MKKTILFLSTIITVLLSTCVVSMAAIHANTITNQNFEVSYTYKYGSGNISFEYVPGGWNYDNWASVSKQKYAKDIYHYADTRINADTVDQAYTLMVE